MAMVFMIIMAAISAAAGDGMSGSFLFFGLTAIFSFGVFICSLWTAFVLAL